MGLEGITMNWYKILKNQITDSKQGVLTSDSPLPKKKKDNCKKKLLQWLENALKIKEKYNLFQSQPFSHITHPTEDIINRWNELPENTVCKILDWFEQELNNLNTLIDDFPYGQYEGKKKHTSIDNYVCIVGTPGRYYHGDNTFFNIYVKIISSEWEPVIYIESLSSLNRYYEHGMGYSSLNEWGRDNLDFRK